MAGKLSLADKKLEKEGQNCLKRAKAHLKRNSAGWDENKLLLMGKLKGGKNAVAEGYGLFKSLTSNILVAAPEVYFEAKKEDQREIASFLTDGVNYDFGIGRLHAAEVKALWRCFPYGFGPVIEQMESEFEYDKKGRKTGIRRQRFFWKSIPNRDVIFDPDGFDIGLSDHRYIFIAHYKSIREIKDYEPDEERDERGYFNLDKIENMPKANEMTRPGPGQQGSIAYSATTGPVPPDEGNPDYAQIKIWRMYDRVNDSVSDFCDADSRLIRHEDWPLPVKIQGVLQYPTKLLALNEETDGFYPPSEVELIKMQLTNLAKMNDTLMTDLTVKIRKYIGLSPYLTKEQMGKLIDQNNPNAFLLTSNLDVLAQAANAPKVDAARDVVSKIEDVEPSPNLVPGMQEVRSQMQNILGYGMPSRGGLPQIRSAKEAARVSDALQKSLMGRQTTIEMFTRDLALYHVLLMKAVAGDDQTMERYAMHTDKLSGMRTWLTYRPAEIPDENYIYCDVYVGTSSPKTLDAKRAQFLQEFSTIMPYIEKMQLSPAPLLYRYADVFSVRGMDQLLKNQRGAAMELLAALVKTGQLGEKAPADLLIKPILNMVDAILPPAMKQSVVQAVLQPQGAGGGEGGVSPEKAPDPFKAMGNPSGAVDMGGAA